MAIYYIYVVLHKICSMLWTLSYNLTKKWPRIVLCRVAGGWQYSSLHPLDLDANKTAQRPLLASLHGALLGGCWADFLLIDYPCLGDECKHYPHFALFNIELQIHEQCYMQCVYCCKFRAKCKVINSSGFKGVPQHKIASSSEEEYRYLRTAFSAILKKKQEQ